VAEDKLSGRKIRCEVFVDRIARIEIETTTRVMYKAEKEVLEVLAFDEHGNKFSSVAGLAFHWSIVPTEADAGTHAVLQLVPFSGSSYDVAQRIRDMEAMSLQGDAVLVEGVGTGRANVVARLDDEDGGGSVGVDTGGGVDHCRAAVGHRAARAAAAPRDLRDAGHAGAVPCCGASPRTSAADALISMPNAQYEWSIQQRDAAQHRSAPAC
jgi:hypothetical protein